MASVVRAIVLALLIIALAAYFGDWAVYKMRGSPNDHVRVSHFVSAPLKNNKQEIDYLGSEDVLCSMTMFPQEGRSPCWYLRRHKNQVTTY
jgi:hypothetical protein